MHLVLSCEHATNRIPSRYRDGFSSKEAELALHSHRGLDYGAQKIARALERSTGARCFYGSVSRLLVDLNRSSHHPQRFSEFSRTLPNSLKNELDRLRSAHEGQVEACLRSLRGQVLHIAIHSFSPVLHGQRREFDVGVLYDPARIRELAWAKQFQGHLRRATGLRIRRNAPYRGVSDGLPTSLRRVLGANYIGIELELNQALIWPRAPRPFESALSASILEQMKDK